MKTLKNLSLLTVVMVLLFQLIGCGKEKQFGAVVPEDMKATSIKAILTDPQSFNEKEVKLEGTLGQICPAGCWFFLHEGGDIKLYIDIHPAGIAIPPKSKGKAMVIGKVVVADKRVAVVGKGVRLL